MCNKPPPRKYLHKSVHLHTGELTPDICSVVQGEPVLGKQPIELCGGGGETGGGGHGEGQSQGPFADNTGIGARRGGPLRLYSICGTAHRSVLAMLGMQARGVKVKGGGPPRVGPPRVGPRERAWRTAAL